MNQEEYFEKQIKGLLMILSDNLDKNPMIARSYITEKLNMILNYGINFHSSIAEKLK